MSAHFTQDELLRQLEGALRPLAEGWAAGELDVVSTPDQLYEILAAAPRSWRLVLGWDGWEEAQGSRESWVNDSYYAIVQIPQGLAVRPGEEVYRQRAGDAPTLMSLIETVDAWFRSMRFPGPTGVDGAGFQTVGGAWFDVEGEPELRQFRLDFRLNRILPNSQELAPGHIVIAKEPN